jgi:hypothetical protein
MNLARTLSLAATALTLTISASAEDVHHPEGAASAPSTAPTAKAAPGPSPSALQNQMKAMQAMHDKMIAAKTPEERSALMAEHMKTMQDGMSMMQGMQGLQGGPGARMDGATRQRMMEMRMDMMQSMMQMMMDRMPAGPSK